MECAIPQFEQTYAPAKPRMPIHATAWWSARENGCPRPRRGSDARTADAMTSRRKASIAGGTLWSVTRAATYDVP